MEKANKTCCRNMSIMQAQVIEKFSCKDDCRLHLMMFWLGENHKKISTPDCHCSPKQYGPFQLPVPHLIEFFHSGTDGECKAKFTCAVNC